MHRDPPDDSGASGHGPGAPRRLPTGTKTLVGLTPTPGMPAGTGRITERGLPAARRQTVRGMAAVGATPPGGSPAGGGREAWHASEPGSARRASEPISARRVPSSSPQSPPRREGRHAEDLAFLTGLRDRLLPHLEWMSRGPHRELLAALADGEVALVEELLEHARRERPRLPEIGLAAAELRRATHEHVTARLGSTEDVPVKASAPARPTAAEERVLGCVNGVSTIEDVLVASELPFAEAVRVLAHLADRGHLLLPGRPPRGADAPHPDRSTLPEILAPFAADLHAMGVGHDRSATPPSRRATERPAASSGPTSSPTASTAPPPPPDSLPPEEGEDPLARALVAAANVPKAPSLPLWSVPPPSIPPPSRRSERPGASVRPAPGSEAPPPPSERPTASSHAPPPHRSSEAPPSGRPAPASSPPRAGDRGADGAEARPSARPSASSSPPRADAEGSIPPRPPSLRPPLPVAAPAGGGASIWVKISTVASLAALLAGGIALVRSGQRPPPPPATIVEAPEPEVEPSEEPEPPRTAAPAPAPPPPSPAPPEPAAIETILLKVRVTPKYARVFLDGVLLAPTTELRVHRRREPHLVRVEAPGFVTQEFTVRAEKDTELSVTLRKRGGGPVAPAPPPAAEGDDPYR